MVQIGELPVVGGRLRTTWQILKAPFESYAAWRVEHGDTFMLRALNGDVVVSCDPAFVADFLKLTDEQHRPFATEATAGVLGSGTMIVTPGDAHKRKRRLVGPHFRGERMRAYAALVDRIARARIAGWSGELRMMDEMLPISMEIIVRAVFGATSDDATTRYMDSIAEVVSRFSPALLFTKHTQRRFFGFGPWARYTDARDRLLGMLRADIEAARTVGDAERTDILSCLATATDEDGEPMPVDEVAEELLGLLFAGHETTQIALAWAVYWLLRHPEALARLRAELETATDAGARLKAPYLEAVINETLRLYPIVPDVLRTLTADVVLGDVQLPAGSNVAIAAALTHMRSDLYADPEAFRPERFLGRRPRPQAFLAFGAGVRRCIGAALAIFEMKLVLAEIVTRVDLELLGDEVPSRRNVTMAPATGVRVRVVGRRAGPD